jgi:hypothetical protein
MAMKYFNEACELGSEKGFDKGVQVTQDETSVSVRGFVSATDFLKMLK